MEEIKDILQDIERSRKSIRLYPSNNPVYINTIDRIYTKLSSFLDVHDELTIRMKQYDILFDSENVYHNKKRDESLALLLFKDGIRELTFIKGIPAAEIRDFLIVLSADFQRDFPEEDIVTLMWEREFQFIQYVVDNEYLLEDEDYEKTAVESIKKHSAEEEDIRNAYKEMANSPEVPDIDTSPFTEEDRKKILLDLELSSPKRFRKLVGLLFEMFFFVHGEGEYASIADDLILLVNYCMEHERPSDAAGIIRKIKRAVEENVYEAPVSGALRHALEVVNSAEFIRSFGNVVSGEGERDEDAIYELAGFFDSRAVPHLIGILGETKNMYLGKILIHILAEICSTDVSLLAQYMDDGRWQLVGNILRVLSRIGDSPAMALVAQATGHPSKHVKVEALNILGKKGTERTLPVIRQCLADQEAVVRIASIRAIGNIRAPASKMIIIEEIGGKSFTDRSFNEKRELFRALAGWKDDDSIDLALTSLGKKSFFRKTKIDETRAAAAYALGVMRAGKALEPLRKLQHSKNALLRKNVVRAMQRIQHG